MWRGGRCCCAADPLAHLPTGMLQLCACWIPSLGVIVIIILMAFVAATGLIGRVTLQKESADRKHASTVLHCSHSALPFVAQLIPQLRFFQRPDAQATGVVHLGPNFGNCLLILFKYDLHQKKNITGISLS